LTVSLTCAGQYIAGIINLRPTPHPYLCCPRIDPREWRFRGASGCETRVQLDLLYRPEGTSASSSFSRSPNVPFLSSFSISRLARKHSGRLLRGLSTAKLQNYEVLSRPRFGALSMRLAAVPELSLLRKPVPGPCHLRKARAFRRISLTQR
jgi:hypothetical protein